MSFVQDARPLFIAAFDNGYALPAFNFCSLEMAKGCLEAAQDVGAPVILQTYPTDIAQASPAVMVAMVRSLAEEVDVPVALHLDHGRDFSQVITCLRAGYSSVMFDGQGLDFAEVEAQTHRLAEIAHACGASLEVGAESFGVPGAADNVHELTDPGQARALRNAGADLVACAVGSEHGSASTLDLELLARISGAVGGPLALHGGSGIPEADLRAALTLGVVKVNVGSALYRATRRTWEASSTLPNHRAVYEAVRDAVRQAALPYLLHLQPSRHIQEPTP